MSRKRKPWGMQVLEREIVDVFGDLDMKASDGNNVFGTYRTLTVAVDDQETVDVLTALEGDPRIKSVESGDGEVTIRMVDTNAVEGRASFGVEGALRVLRDTDEVERQDVDLNSLKKAELVEMNHGLDDPDKATKADLVAAIIANS